MILKKIGNEWKLDAGTLFNLANVPQETTAHRTALAAKLTAISEAMSREIAGGKFPSAGEAYQEFWNRSLAASKELEGAGGGTTQPK